MFGQDPQIRASEITNNHNFIIHSRTGILPNSWGNVDIKPLINTVPCKLPNSSATKTFIDWLKTFIYHVTGTVIIISDKWTSNKRPGQKMQNTWSVYSRIIVYRFTNNNNNNNNNKKMIPADCRWYYRWLNALVNVHNFTMFIIDKEIWNCGYVRVGKGN